MYSCIITFVNASILPNLCISLPEEEKRRLKKSAYILDIDIVLAWKLSVAPCVNFIKMN